MLQQSKAYRVEVETTNNAQDTFTIGEEYYLCVNGCVYVVTDTPAKIFAKIPNARSITYIGPALMMSGKSSRKSNQ